jgi:outer membrane protein TolC
MRSPIVALLCFAGCVSRPDPGLGWEDVPADHSRPAAPPAQVREGKVPIDLPTALRLAGAHSLDIALVREKLHEAYARVRLAEERLWPTLGPAFSFRRHEGLTQDTGGAIVDVDKQLAFAGGGASLRWEVGEAIYAALSASQRYEGGKARLEAAEREVLLEAGTAYYDLVRERLRARVAEQSTGVSERLAAQLEISVAAGRGFRGDVLRARVRAASSRLELLRAREAMRQASIRLGSILRLAPGIDLVPAEEAPPILDLVPLGSKDDALLAEALERRPEVREARSELEAARSDQSGALWGPLVPTVQGDVVLGGLGVVPGNLGATTDYAVTVGWRIGPGGLFDPGRRDLADARARQAEIQVERVRQRVAEELLSGLNRLRSADEQRKLAEQAVLDAEAGLTLNQQRQDRDIGLPLEVLQAEEALTKARLDLHTTVVAYDQAQLRVFASLGHKHTAAR